MAEILAAEEAGVEELLLKSWLSARDEAVRIDHIMAEQAYERGIELSEDFTVGGDSMPAPGNGSDPAQNINCRCALIYVNK